MVLFHRTNGDRTMNFLNSPKTDKTHGIVAKVFHWGFIAVFIYAIYKGLDNVEQLQDTSLLRFEIVFALGFLVLLAVRFFYMRAVQPTAVPDDAPTSLKMLSRLGHMAIYISVGMIAFTGVLIGALYGSGSTSGAMIEMVITVHEFSVQASYVSIAVHIAAAIFHRIKGDGIWSAMVPIFKEHDTREG